MKICSRCKTEKPFDAYQMRRASKDGLTSACKVCLSAYDADRYARMWHKIRQRQRRYASTAEAKLASLRANRAYILRYPHKQAARQAVSNAIRDGKIFRPASCQQCSSGARLHAHHDDYSKPLDVRWLCVPCHEAAHHGERATSRIYAAHAP